MIAISDRLRANPISSCAMRTTKTVPTKAMNGIAHQAHSTRPKARNKAQLIGTSTSRYRPNVQNTKLRLGTEIPAASVSAERTATLQGL